MKKHISVDYKKHPPVINVNKITIDILLKQTKPDQLIALYFFYCYTSCWQHTLQVRATTNYTAKGLGWCRSKTQQVKKRLVELGLIRDVQSRKGGRFGKRYVRVYYITVGDETVCTAEVSGEMLSNGYKNKCLENVVEGKKPSTKRVKFKHSANDVRRAKKLQDIILTKRNVQLDIRGWPDIFRQLRKINKISPDRIKAVLKWYEKNIGEEYIPEAYSATTFRKKFINLEHAMHKQKRKKIKEEEDENPCEYRMGSDGEMGFYAKDE